MKKKVTFEKKIEFPTMIGEISAISLDNNLKFVNESEIEGDLLLSGKYKLTEASRIEEDFKYNIPTEISLTEKLDINTSNIEISDFYYEIENNDTMICNIELSIEGLEKLEEIEEENSDRECDSEIIEKEIEIPTIDKKETIEEDKEKIENIDEEEIENIDEEEIEIEERNKSLFINLEDDNDTYGTFLVYIVRQNESINTILEKYHTTMEEIQKYNDVNNINIGTKLIIPYVNEN